ncbi:DoxX family protein [Nocardioides sp. Kera G14]|uniref:DoxX family protein n=1 Tax=Nocardioides sp. Kera G14 TaxID=2884264 RepID=UPI001D10E097|nr:DoxX family protein [Nocardioides sp. Kera G14]UDY24899.1 DoxX family protein [Nocardioides sp. Kera G14]
MSISRRLARPLLSSIFFVGPIRSLKNASGPAERAKPVTDPLVTALQRAGLPVPADPELLVKVNAGVQLAAATGLVLGRFPRLSAAVLAGTLVPTTLAGHAFWRESDPEARRAQQLQLAKNVSILGGLVIAALDTDGKPGKAWLAKATARELARQAEHVASTTKLEGRIAALQAAGAGDVLTEKVGSAAATVVDRGHAVAGTVADVVADKLDATAEKVGQLRH